MDQWNKYHWIELGGGELKRKASNKRLLASFNKFYLKLQTGVNLGLHLLLDLCLAYEVTVVYHLT